MGAGQSSDGTGSGNADVQVKTSYYELLGTHRQATEDEIKKAYRRKALELHPDRNYGNEEQATKTFAEVQAAYEVLSDAQERAWYDSHESAILRGDDGTEAAEHSYENIRVTTADDLARVVRKFNSNVEFTDSPSGFFGFLSEQFEHLAKEEEVAATWENADVPEYPNFGHKDDTHDDVVKTFYTAWTNFSTVKSFAWKDKYRLSEAPDRRIRRLMEKENMSSRQDAIREFNEAVRTFVLFVRKRDPRYQPSTQSEAERQQVLRDAAAAQRARARAANQVKVDESAVPEWTKVREPDELELSSEEEIVEEILECVACNKSFKSERQFEAHERSKKHQKAVHTLQRKMQKENQHLQLDDELDHATEGLADSREWEIIGESEDEAADESLSEAEASATQSTAGDEAYDVRPADGQASHDSQQQTVNTSGVDQHYSSASDLEEQAARSIEQLSLHKTDDENTAVPSRKVGKAAQKRAKKAAAAASTTENENNHRCASCDATFPSRTRLFQHIKDHGHAAVKSTVGGSKVKKGKSKR